MSIPGKIYFYILWPIFAILLTCVHAHGQEDYLQQEMKVKKVNEQKWKSLTKDLDYSQQPKEKKKEVPEETASREEKSSSEPFVFGPAAKIIVYGIAIALLLFILLKLLGFDLFHSNKKVKQASSISIEHFEEEIHESDLEKFLREALSSGDHRLAIRIYYLMVLKELSQKQWITWKKDKTNREYLSEMSSRENYPAFMEITRIFEHSWYGESKVLPSDYATASPRFKSFVEDLKRKNA